MEFARGMYVLSYLPLLPAATTIAVGVTSAAISIHFIADAITNFVIGFLLKRLGTHVVLTTGFLVAFFSLFLVIWFPESPIVIILSAILLGVAVSPIWVIMLAGVDEAHRGKQMGYVYFAWLMGLLSGMIVMNLLFKVDPKSFIFMMALFVAIAWILYYFVKITLTNYNTRPVKAQVRQIVDVMKRHILLFPGIVLQGAGISALIPILPTYATKTVGVSTLGYTAAIIVGGLACTVSMLFCTKVIDRYGQPMIRTIVLGGFIIYAVAIFSLSIVTHIGVVLAVSYTHLRAHET